MASSSTIVAVFQVEADEKKIELTASVSDINKVYRLEIDDESVTWLTAPYRFSLADLARLLLAGTAVPQSDQVSLQTKSATEACMICALSFSLGGVLRQELGLVLPVRTIGDHVAALTERVASLTQRVGLLEQRPSHSASSSSQHASQGAVPAPQPVLLLATVFYRHKHTLPAIPSAYRATTRLLTETVKTEGNDGYLSCLYAGDSLSSFKCVIDIRSCRDKSSWLPRAFRWGQANAAIKDDTFIAQTMQDQCYPSSTQPTIGWFSSNSQLTGATLVEVNRDHPLFAVLGEQIAALELFLLSDCRTVQFVNDGSCLFQNTRIHSGPAPFSDWTRFVSIGSHPIIVTKENMVVFANPFPIKRANEHSDDPPVVQGSTDLLWKMMFHLAAHYSR